MLLGFQGSCAPPTHAAKTPFKRNLVRHAADKVKGTSKKRVGLGPKMIFLLELGTVSLLGSIQYITIKHVIM